MNIRIDKYAITNDSRQYMVSEVKVSTGEKTAGEEVLLNTTFHSNIPSALEALLERKVKESDAKTLGEFKKDFDEAIAWIKAQFEGLDIK